MRDIRRRELKKRWVHPIQGFMTPIVQIPLWVTLSISYRHLTGLNMFSAHGGDSEYLLHCWKMSFGACI